MEKNELPSLIFRLFFDNWQKFVKEGDMSIKRKEGFTDLLKPQNLGEVVVLAKSVIFAYKSSYLYSVVPQTITLFNRLARVTIQMKALQWYFQRVLFV